jgi:hypothetical protein
MQFQTPRRLTACTRSYSAPEGIGHFHGRRLNAGIIVSRIQPAEGAHGLRDHVHHIILVGDVAAQRAHLMPGSGELIRSLAGRLLVDIRKCHGCPRFGERRGGCEPDAGAGAGNRRHLAVKTALHGNHSLCGGEGGGPPGVRVPGASAGTGFR